MQKRIPLIVAAAASLAIGGCNKSAQSAADSDSKVAETIKAQDVQWAKDYAAKDVDAIDAHYASDGALAGPGYLATNSNERRAVLTAFMSDPNFSQNFSTVQVDVAPSGDFAASRGHFSVTMTDSEANKPVDYDGSYLTVYRKEPDGSWKAVDRFLTIGPLPLAATAKPAAAK